MSITLVTDDTAITRLAEQLDGAPCIGLDTEFMRERTYRPQLCLLQLSTPTQIACVDPLAGASLDALNGVLTSDAVVKVIHAARQDLEALWPLFGRIGNVFDTQVAAALAGMSAQIGYSELVRRLLNIELAKSQTRTDWSRRPLSDAQLDYAADDVRHLGTLRERLMQMLADLGRLGWLDEELRDLCTPEQLFVDPDRAHERLRWAGELDADRARLAQHLATWRERRAIDKNRPRTWILDDAALRALTLSAPRHRAALAALPELTPGFIERSGAAILEVIAAADLPAQLPPPPARSRPDPQHTAQVKRLSAIVQDTARELSLSAEILATRRDLEALAHGRRDIDALRGWRRQVVGEKLLAGC
ncbi:MAG: ribonuclease D [Nevskiaceae bacterium]|jgi:ribonuclease D|nr:ribonuclease D [Nevskiaceae bacterium]